MRLSELTTGRATPFSLLPNAPERKAIADALGIVAIKKLKFEGTLTPQGRSDWTLQAKLGATVVQDCVVTLDPVTTRIDEEIARAYMAEIPEIDAAELEMSQDDAIDPLPETLDLAQVMIEALSLALPSYPRSAGADLGKIAVTAPGIAPMSDDDAKPFAGLGALRESLEKKEE
ncbi:DUF177 domain-containing protein [Yoonia sp.]|uniref:YceD family protein n=1 Tax=Yoonia sp. TaxID=2212373 RepID=UPI0025FA1591|nr:DUF177 domain-containing protein [Yoonia sp.]